jgi:hypothetical protein
VRRAACHPTSLRPETACLIGPYQTPRIWRNGFCRSQAWNLAGITRAARAHMIKLTDTREITPFLWVHPDDER